MNRGGVALASLVLAGEGIECLGESFFQWGGGDRLSSPKGEERKGAPPGRPLCSLLWEAARRESGPPLFCA